MYCFFYLNLFTEFDHQDPCEGNPCNQGRFKRDQRKKWPIILKKVLLFIQTANNV